MVFDCSTVTPELSGSELFGHERGAFTGAISAREGAFAMANGKTLFLDEIGELPLALQTQLLRAIQEKKYKRVGGNVWYSSDFRLVCATNRNLEQLIAQGQFRLDLYHRISGWVFRTLPLRERREDILPMARFFVAALYAPKAPPKFDPAVNEFLLHRDYPGNVRELRHLIERIVHRHVGPGPMTAGDIPEEDRPVNGELKHAWPDEQFDKTIAEAILLGAGIEGDHAGDDRNCNSHCRAVRERKFAAGGQEVGRHRSCTAVAEGRGDARLNGENPRIAIGARPLRKGANWGRNRSFLAANVASQAKEISTHDHRSVRRVQSQCRDFRQF